MDAKVNREAASRLYTAIMGIRPPGGGAGDYTPITDGQEEWLRSALDSLSEREREVVAMRFGLYDGNPHTLDEIGQVYGVVRQRIRNIMDSAYRGLRRHSSAAHPA